MIATIHRLLELLRDRIGEGVTPLGHRRRNLLRNELIEHHASQESVDGQGRVNMVEKVVRPEKGMPMLPTRPRFETLPKVD